MRNLLDSLRPERSNPFREFNALQRQMDRFFDDFVNYPTTAKFRKDVDFVPACDFQETDKNYLISLDVPGMTKDQLRVELTGNSLTITGEQKEGKKEAKWGQRYFERYQGRFERSFTLPQASETDKVEADYKDGVLHIAVPKAAAALAKTKNIQIGEGNGTSFGKLPRTEEKKEQKPSVKAA